MIQSVGAFLAMVTKHHNRNECTKVQNPRRMRCRMRMHLSVKATLRNAGRTLALQWSSFTQQPTNPHPFICALGKCVVVEQTYYKRAISHVLHEI